MVIQYGQFTLIKIYVYMYETANTPQVLAYF